MRKLFSFKTLLILIAVFLGSTVILSIFYETLLPLLRAEEWLAFFANLVGIPVILAGTGAVCWGGFLLLGGMARIDRNTKGHTWQVLKPGTLWFLGGFGLFVLGAYISNIS